MIIEAETQDADLNNITKKSVAGDPRSSFREVRILFLLSKMWMVIRMDMSANSCQTSKSGNKNTPISSPN